MWCGCVYFMGMATANHHKENEMNTTTNIILNDDERYMLITILDIARQDETDDDEFREKVACFAERLYIAINNATTYQS